MGQETPKAKQARNNSLVVIDNRTGKRYSVPITRNSVPATFFKSIRAPAGPDDRPEDETERGLCISDRECLNTAVIEGAITYIDGERGILRYRGYPIEQPVEKSTFLECAYLLIYGALPARNQLFHFEREVLLHGIMHADATKCFGSFRYDSHPMAMLMTNPSLQGTYPHL
ncbi:citrate synthase-like protein [Pisolithus sp. B1]|nr:citrate synthase-like protein [Pisolithus sp. B1]